MSVADTSRSAYRSVDLQRREREVMTAIHLHFPAPARFTRKELAAAMGWEINRITGRVLTLIERRYLTEHEQTRDGAHLLSIRQTDAAAPAETPSPTSKEAIEPAAAAPYTPQRAGPVPAQVNVPTVSPAGHLDDKPAPGSSALGIARANADRARANREAMPGVTTMVDELRSTFPDCRVTYAAEGGIEVGRRGAEGIPVTPPGPRAERRARRAA